MSGRYFWRQLQLWIFSLKKIVPYQNSNSFKPVSEIEISGNNSIVDLTRIVMFVNPSIPTLRKNGMETKRRILNLKDGSGWAIVQQGRSKIERDAVKAGKVSDFNGKSLGIICLRGRDDA
ncbi:hypothetical protein NC651_016227 [Populus alba x Populus x berolinensis]|nr:hypothetical protein NC651_016227 [Populus alba x Populus x berolinensis]